MVRSRNKSRAPSGELKQVTIDVVELIALSFKSCRVRRVRLVIESLEAKTLRLSTLLRQANEESREWVCFCICDVFDRFGGMPVLNNFRRNNCTLFTRIQESTGLLTYDTTNKTVIRITPSDEWKATGRRRYKPS